jgi:hypothetical protein
VIMAAEQWAVKCYYETPAEVTDPTIDEPNRNGFPSASVVLLDVISE